MEINEDKIKKIKGAYIEMEEVCKMFDYTETGLKKKFNKNGWEIVKFKTLIPLETVMEMVKEKELKKIYKKINK